MNNYEIIGWPEIEDYKELEGFDCNATLIEEHGALGIDSDTYLVSKARLDSLEEDSEEDSEDA